MNSRAETSTEAPAEQAQPDDLSLLARYTQQDDRDALGALFQRHADAAYSTALRVCRHPDDAEDAVQIAFVKIMQNASAYRGGEGVRVWIMKVVIGTCKDRIRHEVRRRQREEHAMEWTDDGLVPAESAGDDGMARDMADAVLHLLDRLPEHYRLPVWLHHYQGLSLGDAAVALEIPENTLRSQLSRGLEKLRGMLVSRGMAASVASIAGVMPMMQAEAAPASLVGSIGYIVHGLGEF